ncbi:MAG: acyltransferase [Rhodospirillaceae bacterium]|nr:acyltransferase [Rhodospirillaceae bacterium]
MPALFLVMLASLLAGYTLMTPAEFVALGESAFAQSLFSSNIYFLRHGGYFSGESELKPLLHTWSLSVEEQFYLLYPLLIFFLRRYQRALTAVLAIGFFASLTACVFISLYAPEETLPWTIFGNAPSINISFYMLPTRAWQLLAGGLLVLCPISYPARYAGILALAGIVFIGVSVFSFDSFIHYPGYYANLPVLGAVLVIQATENSGTRVGRVLSTDGFRWIGLISYSLYLWHWPLLSFHR